MLVVKYEENNQATGVCQPLNVAKRLHHMSGMIFPLIVKICVFVLTKQFEKYNHQTRGCVFFLEPSRYSLDLSLPLIFSLP